MKEQPQTQFMAHSSLYEIFHIGKIGRLYMKISLSLHSSSSKRALLLELCLFLQGTSIDGERKHKIQYNDDFASEISITT